MALYKTTQEELTLIKEKPFKLEREIQTMFEQNIELLMGLELVKSEFTIHNRRIDTLCFDPQTKAFIIIEYKRDRNSSVVDQGFTYLSLMLQYKADFILEYNENLHRNLKRDEVDWSQTRVVFVSSGFTDNQREATNFKDLAIELWEVKRYENGIVSIVPVRKSKSATSIKPVARKSKELDQVINEIKVYTEEEHLQNKPEETIELYQKFRTAILNLADDIEIVPKKVYVAFKKTSNICDISIQKKSLLIYINQKKDTLDDPKGLAEDISAKGHHGNGDYQVKITSDKDLEYVMSLVKQAIR